MFLVKYIFIYIYYSIRTKINQIKHTNIVRCLQQLSIVIYKTFDFQSFDVTFLQLLTFTIT